MTPGQVKLVRTLLNKAGLIKNKIDIVYSFTDNRTEHLSDMTYAETKAIIAWLYEYLGEDANSKDRMTNKILSMAHELYWELADGRVDMQRINNWCVQYSGKNKPLDAFLFSELPALVSQFEMYYKSFLKGI